MKKEDVMVSDEIFEMTEKEVEEMLASIMGSSEDPDERRIESIMKRVRVETVLRESTDFMAEGLSSGLKGIADAFTGIVKDDPDPPKRSY